MSANLSQSDIELLSAYIDGELPDAERLALEIRLDAEPDLRRELALMRQTVALVSQLPKLKAPRDFTLTVPTQVKVVRKLPFILSGTFSALSAAAAFLLVLFGGYLLLGTSLTNSSLQTSQVAMQQSTMLPATLLFDQTVGTPTAAKTLSPTPMAQGGMANSAPAAPPTDGDQAGEDDITQTQMELFSIEATEETADFMFASPAEAEESVSEEAGLTSIALPTGTAVTSAMDAVSPSVLATLEATQADVVEQAVQDGAATVDAETAAMERQQSLPTATVPMLSTQATSPTTVPAPQQEGRARTVQMNNSTVGLIVLGLGVVLLVVALATTIARRNARV